uniref:Si:cabz01007807.1 n=1 Tax=Stegastes partitus TaxID=144197 RepID=A0A3B5B4A8_9TELE
MEDDDEDGVSSWLLRNNHHILINTFGFSSVNRLCIFFPQDTDSLMEWWYTVERESQSDGNQATKINSWMSFTILADKVHRGLRVFNKVFTERAEVLWQSIIMLHAIADDISDFHHKAKIAGITGGTTTAVGGVTAIAGLALAPFTFGASLVITAVGVGVATAGGITSASAAISDNVNNMHDRKKVEAVLLDYENHLLDIGKILHFINQGLYKLRGHPFLRSGTQHYSEDWEIRRAVQMVSLVDSPVMRATEITDGAVASLQGLFKGIDQYFIKDSRELKKGCKKEMVGQIKEVATVLNDGIVELNAIREELQDTTGKDIHRNPACFQTSF